MLSVQKTRATGFSRDQVTWYACMLVYYILQVSDPSTVYVHVALGFHVEFTLPEAISFAGIKRSKLKQEIQKLRKHEKGVKRDVASADMLIRELRALENVP